VVQTPLAQSDGHAVGSVRVGVGGGVVVGGSFEVVMANVRLRVKESVKDKENVSDSEIVSDRESVATKEKEDVSDPEIVSDREATAVKDAVRDRVTLLSAVNVRVTLAEKVRSSDGVFVGDEEPVRVSEGEFVLETVFSDVAEVVAVRLLADRVKDSDEERPEVNHVTESDAETLVDGESMFVLDAVITIE
jgi:hypothetical protein